MRINHNIAALNTYRQLNSASTAQSKSMEKLSSGLRINRAGDDAAGLAISEKMRAQVRGLDQASSNAQDGISMIQTAEGALNETHSILQRMRELATQAGNDTNTADDRKEIQNEINQLTSEINRIGNTTEFNTQKLLNGGSEVTNVSVTPTTPPDLGAATGALGSVTGSAGSAATPGTPAVWNTGAFTPLTNTQTGTFVFNGVTVNITGADTGSVIANNFTGASVDVTIDTTGNADAQAAELIAALDAYKADLGAGSQLDNFTFGGNGTGITITGQAADGDNNNALAVTTSGDVAIANAGAAQLTTPGVDPGAGTQGTTSFTITTALGAGDTFDVAGETITVYATDADLLAASDSFGISLESDATADDQAGAIRAMTFADRTVTGSGATVTLSQTVNGTGDVTQATAVSGSGATPGVYEFSAATAVAAGGSYTIDGEEILVVDDATAYSAEIAAGTAIMAGIDADEQTTNLIAAINLNSTLSTTYTAAPGTGSTDIELTQVSASLTAPAVTTSSQAGATGDFSATLQIGANTGQSFSIDINDMRAFALGISGTAGSTATSTSDPTVTAKFTAVDANDASKGVTNGTNSTVTEYALDVSTHENATAAITLLDDAINKVSSERSKLGAYQNRLDHTINNLGTSSENLTAAESRIRDVDYALAA